MTEINHFMHDFREWVKSIPDHEKILRYYYRGLITFDEVVKMLKESERGGHYDCYKRK